ncbi:hypothetical protein [Desulfospira joergensenii]|uniref:hypothetical protein n=1 Tax=Desulfospira joergensenii TaxID=53329 RepID=UPI0004054D75|nr:hypothetical protein [Desulfospira joergensenii]
MVQDVTKEKLIHQWEENSKAFAKAVKGKNELMGILGISKQDLTIIYQKAFDAFQVEDYREAENLFSCLLLWDFQDRAYQVGLGATFEAQEKFEAALNMYVLAMLSGGQDPELLFRSGKCLLALDQKAEAAILFELAAESEDNLPQLHLKALGAIEKSKNMLSLINN